MEKTFIIPLRKEYQKAPMYKRTKRAVSATKIFLQKHMKTDNIKLGRHLNMKLWKDGYKNPPHKVEVSVELIKDPEGDYVYAELVGITKEPLKPIIEEKKTTLASKLEGITGTKKEDKSKADIQKEEEKKEAEKVIKEVPLKDSKDKVATGVDTKKEELEQARQETLVKRDMKQDQKKKE